MSLINYDECYSSVYRYICDRATYNPLKQNITKVLHVTKKMINCHYTP